MKIKTAGLIGALFVLFLFYYINPFNIENKRLMNIYGYTSGLEPGKINDSDCVVKVLQIRKDSIFRDTCYVKYHELMSEYERVGDNFTLNFKGEKIEKHKSYKKDKESIYSKLNLIPTEKLRMLEDELSNYSCDVSFGIELELIESGTLEVIHLRDIRTCSGKHKKFITKLIEEFNN